MFRNLFNWKHFVLCNGPRVQSNIFKIPLEELWKSYEGEPDFFQIAVTYLRQKGLGDLRIFRDAPDPELYEQFISIVEEGRINVIQQEITEYNPSPMIVAWFLRNFLFHLPTPLITDHYKISNRLLDAIDIKMPETYKQSDEMDVDINTDDPDEGILELLCYIKSLIMALKPEYHHTLRAMVSLFHDISVHQKDDGFESLDAHHLAQVFGPIFVGLKHHETSETTKPMILSQDLALFLINHYHDIFERNTFKELVVIHRTNRELEKVQKEQSQCIRDLKRKSNNLSDKLSAEHWEYRLKSRLFLSWRAYLPRVRSERKPFIKLQSLTNSLDISKEIIEKQSRKIDNLETKLELSKFDQQLVDASVPLCNILKEQTRRNSLSHVVGGGNRNQREYLRQSIAEIVHYRRYDEALTRDLTRDTSYKSLFEPYPQNIANSQTL